MPVKWFDSKIDKKVDRAKIAYLLANGQALVNQMVDLAHVQTGLLRNSVHYKLYTGKKSEFGNEVGPKKGRTQPKSDEVVTAPALDNIRTGSSIIYAGIRNRSDGWADRAVDMFKSENVAVKLGKSVFRKFFK